MRVDEHRTARRPLIVGSTACLLAGVVAVVWVGVRAAPEAPRDIDTVTQGSLSYIAEGMRPAEVEAVLGQPSKEVVSLAEGFAWPEPKVTCWYYPSPDPSREYQVCFIGREVTTAGSYVVPGR